MTRNPRLLMLLALGVTAGAGCLLLAGCERSAPAKGMKNPRVIFTHPIEVPYVIDYQDFTGRLEAVKSIDIRARVTGYVTEVPFKEGDLVKEGNLLFQIDLRPYQADFNQAVENLKLAIAERDLQEKNAERARKLYASRTIAIEDYETTIAAANKAAASVGAMEAARDRAKLYLDYTRVTAPVSGRISRRYVDPGNLINADNTVLTTLVTENPMYAYFDVDERTYLGLMESVSPDRHSWSEGLRPPVAMRLANEDDFEKDRVGYIDFVDNRVIGTSGTVRMRGVFQNSTGLLRAGLFVRIRLPIRDVQRPILVLDEAIQSDQERKYVWVVNAHNEVEYRSVQLGQGIREWRVIQPPEKGKEGKEGLAVGDRVIVSGMQRVRKGLAVDAEELHPTPTPPDMPLLRLLHGDKGGRVRADKVTR